MYHYAMFTPHNILYTCRERLVLKEYEVVLVMMEMLDMLVTKEKEDYVALRYAVTMTTVE